jgi:hypothetical protein
VRRGFYVGGVHGLWLIVLRDAAGATWWMQVSPQGEETEDDCRSPLYGEGTYAGLLAKLMKHPNVIALKDELFHFVNQAGDTMTDEQMMQVSLIETQV